MNNIIIAIVLGGCILLASCYVVEGLRYRKDHGYVSDERGNEWQMKRMQTFGIAGEWIAVYRPTSGMRNSEDGS